MLGLEDEVGVEIVGNLRPVTEASRGDAIVDMMPSVSSFRSESIED
jgi:hypothetical protein